MSALPKSVGKYQVLERLAVGGMAELLKARVVGAAGFEKLVAIKKILPQLAADPAFVEMFFDEARLCAQLEHPNIVGVFELGTDADTPYIAMQFVDGMDVLELLRQCARAQIRLPPELAAFIARNILDALDYAHNARDASGRPLGVIHRDVSPGNVLVSWRGDVKLTDFGIARAIERQHKTEAGTLKGKYGYMAPEQVSGNELSARTDVFALGIVLAEMVMARRLFTAPNDLDVLLMVRDARLDRLNKYAMEFPVELRVIVVKALQRRPDDRWASAGAFRDAIDDWLARQGRWTTRELADFVGRVVDAPTVDPDVALARAASIADGEDTGGTLSGPSTRMSNARALAEARAARASFISGDGAATPDPVIQQDSSAAITIEDGGLQEPSQLGTPTERAPLREHPLIGLLYQLHRQRASGLLTLEHPGGAIKEAYLVDGQPQYVHSNVPGERLGSFLVNEGALSAEALARAVAVMHHFEGRLADTVVGLGVLRPLDAYRLLAKQVAAKLIDACTWTEGLYLWRAGVASPFTARPLHLDALRIVGSGAMAIDPTTMARWASDNAGMVAVAVAPPAADLTGFGLGEVPGRVLGMLDGRVQLGELAQRPRSAEARLNLLRVIYLLVQCKLARLS
ncbi:MAG: serine/threonine protein kinase [Kofleriaceae bacterium]|jgi:serine/threonine protein kinase|nr:serine/threonine protein kinase [Kofleriaceae bacterium]MBP6840071.1 serine/threonine protein kinase [Kofleriaceae bacterium]